ncbi:MAG: hypothetical protein VX730_08530 [Pseudomonadota bacterium]|nr:hypothetical protein [Pseudomonadota bacterium]
MPKYPVFAPATELINSLKGRIDFAEIEAFSLEGNILVLRLFSMEGADDLIINMDIGVELYDFLGAPYLNRKTYATKRMMLFEVKFYGESWMILRVPEDVAQQMQEDLHERYAHKQAVTDSRSVPVAMVGLNRTYHAAEYGLGPQGIEFTITADSGGQAKVSISAEKISKVSIYGTSFGKIAVEVFDHDGGAISFYMDAYVGATFALALRTVADVNHFMFEIDER